MYVHVSAAFWIIWRGSRSQWKNVNLRFTSAQTYITSSFIAASSKSLTAVIIIAIEFVWFRALHKKQTLMRLLLFWKPTHGHTNSKEPSSNFHRLLQYKRCKYIKDGLIFSDTPQYRIKMDLSWCIMCDKRIMDDNEALSMVGITSSAKLFFLQLYNNEHAFLDWFTLLLRRVQAQRHK